MDITVERRGSGEPLVLFHGIGHRWQAWTPVLDKLAVRHQVLAIDLPGFGQSPVPPGGVPGSMPDTVAAVADFFREAGLDRPHVAGNSLGGAIALELAAAGQAASATALSPAGFFTGWERRWAIGVLRAHRMSVHLPEWLIRRAANSPALRVACWGMLVGKPRRLDPELALGDALALRDGKGFEAVAKGALDYAFAGNPTVPVTVAWGTRDRVLLPRQAKRARERLPQARHVALPGCGHIPMNDAPDLVASLILATTALAPAPPSPPPPSPPAPPSAPPSAPPAAAI
jgi:pimeloyl-ACP methyl ester carboxylesterase